jgi:hypothetical protein
MPALRPRGWQSGRGVRRLAQHSGTEAKQMETVHIRKMLPVPSMADQRARFFPNYPNEKEALNQNSSHPFRASIDPAKSGRVQMSHHEVFSVTPAVGLFIRTLPLVEEGRWRRTSLVIEIADGSNAASRGRHLPPGDQANKHVRCEARAREDSRLWACEVRFVEQSPCRATHRLG